MSLESEYRGYVIRYSENADEWNCYDAQASAPTLGKLKAKIDNLHLKMRKASAVDGFEIESYSREPRLTPCRLVEYLGEKWDKSWNSPQPEFKGHLVASVATRGGRERAARKQVLLSEIASVGPETEAALARARETWGRLKEAESRHKDAVRAIPRVEVSAIGDLMSASSARLEEQTADES